MNSAGFFLAIISSPRYVKRSGSRGFVRSIWSACVSMRATVPASPALSASNTAVRRPFPSGKVN